MYTLHCKVVFSRSGSNPWSDKSFHRRLCSVYVHCVSKKCHFYFCNNFGKCRPILIILSLLYSQIYTADEGGIKTITSAQVCCRTTLRNLNAQLSCIIGCNLYRPEPINACMTTSYDIRRLDVMRGLQSYNYSEKVQRILYPLCSYNMTTRYQGHWVSFHHADIRLTDVIFPFRERSGYSYW